MHIVHYVLAHSRGKKPKERFVCGNTEVLGGARNGGLTIRKFGCANETETLRYERINLPFTSHSVPIQLHSHSLHKNECVRGRIQDYTELESRSVGREPAQHRSFTHSLTAD